MLRNKTWHDQVVVPELHSMQSRSNGSQPAKADQVSDSMILAIWAYERAMVLFWSLRVLHVLVPAYHAQGCMEQKHRLCPRRKQTNDPKSDFRMCSQTRARGDMPLRPKHRIDWPNNIGGDLRDEKPHFAPKQGQKPTNRNSPFGSLSKEEADPKHPTFVIDIWLQRLQHKQPRQSGPLHTTF